MRFFLGLLAGLVALGGYVGYDQYRRSKDPCLGLCGEGTECQDKQCLAVEDEVKPNKRRRRKRRRRGWRRRRRGGKTAANNTNTVDQPTTKKPTAADLRRVTQGPSLKQTEYIDATKSGGGGRELSTEEIMAKVRRSDRRIIACIDKARGDYELSGVRISVGFRVERAGQIKKVRISAPAVLMRGGLGACIRGILTGLSFPRSTRAAIMTIPYKLD